MLKLLVDHALCINCIYLSLCESISIYSCYTMNEVNSNKAIRFQRRILITNFAHFYPISFKAKHSKDFKIFLRKSLLFLWNCLQKRIHCHPTHNVF